MNKTHKILSIILITLLTLPAIRQPFNVLNELNGAYLKQEFPVFSYSDWKSLDFQNKTEKCVKDHFGFRPEMVRFANQVNYSLFNDYNKEQGMLVGKNNYLYQKGYAIASSGDDYIGYDSIYALTCTLLKLEKTLKNKNTHLLILLAPDKVSYYPNNLPINSNFNLKTDSTNYNTFKKLLLNSNLNLIDFNPFFLSLKDTVKYPLFPKYGIHWSHYGCMFAIDTLTKKIENILNINLVDFSISEIEISNKPKIPDYDLGDLLNLTLKLPKETLAYPKYKFDTTNYYSKPNVLILGDSFYVNIFRDNPVTQKAFNKNNYYQYMKCFTTNNEYKSNYSTSYDLVIIEATTINILQINKWISKYLCYSSNK